MMDKWPAIRVKRFEGEAKAAYDQRKAEIVAIISGFRKGRFEGPMADKLDLRLDHLLTGDFDEARHDPYGVIGWEQSGQWPAWLAVPLGVGMGPMYLIGDLMTLSDGSLQDMIALPQALVGGAVGGAQGWLVASVRK